jgi:hypothetical protein
VEPDPEFEEFLARRRTERKVVWITLAAMIAAVAALVITAISAATRVPLP